MPQTRDNFKAGLFVIFGIVLAIGAVLIVTDFDRMFETTQRVQVFYNLSDGLQELKVGAPVTLGDFPVGEVVEIENVVDAADHGEQRVIGLRVIFEMSAEHKLFQNPVIMLKPPLLGSNTKLNIVNVGQGEPYKPSQTIDGILAGTPQVSQAIREMGIEEKQRAEIQNTIEHLEAITTKLRADLPAITAKVRALLDDAAPIITSVEQVVGDVKEAVVNVKQVVAEVKARSGGWFGRIDSISESADTALADVRDMVHDKRPTVERSLDNVEAITQRARDETLEQLSQAMIKLDATLDHAKVVAREARAVMVGQRPVIERMVANLQITAGQLKLAAVEIRRSPWRLLHRPDDQEYETDNLYDAARSFALAAGALEASAASLQSVLEYDAVEKDQLQQKLDYFEKLFGKFKETEQSFWDALQKQAPVE